MLRQARVAVDIHQDVELRDFDAEWRQGLCKRLDHCFFCAHQRNPVFEPRIGPGRLLRAVHD
jgi:hypothetical protein